MTKNMQSRATWNQEVEFTVETGTGSHITLDGEALSKAGPDAASPLEMILSALVGCMGVSVIGILQKMRQEVTSYQLTAHGEVTEGYPQVFKHIEVRHSVRGEVKASAIEKALHLAEERYCGVSAMLGKTVEIVHTYTLNEEEK